MARLFYNQMFACLLTNSLRIQRTNELCKVNLLILTNLYYTQPPPIVKYFNELF